MVARLGGDALAYRQADAPLIAEVEHVADSLAALKVELGERDVGRGDALVGRIRRGQLDLVRAEEAAVEPERVQVVVVPAECLLDRVVQSGERLALKNTASLARTPRTFSSSASKTSAASPAAAVVVTGMEGTSAARLYPGGR